MLSQPSDVSDLVPSRLVSISLLSPHVFRHITYCLSQAFGCSDCYTISSLPPLNQMGLYDNIVIGSYSQTKASTSHLSVQCPIKKWPLWYHCDSNGPIWAIHISIVPPAIGPCNSISSLIPWIKWAHTIISPVLFMSPYISKPTFASRVHVNSTKLIHQFAHELLHAHHLSTVSSCGYPVDQVAPRQCGQ